MPLTPCFLQELFIFLGRLSKHYGFSILSSPPLLDEIHRRVTSTVRTENMILTSTEDSVEILLRRTVYS